MVDVAFEASAEDMVPADGEAMPEAQPDEAMARAQFLAYVAAPETINFAGDLPEEQRKKLAREVLDEYRIDKDSMADWLAAMQKGIDLSLLKKTDKNYPWDGAANIKFPLVTSAALQFNARAYPAIVPNGDFVLCRTYGADPQGIKAARAQRVAAHMSWQLASVVTEWEEETDRLLTVWPLVGTMFRKVWFDPSRNRICVRMCPPGSVIVNDGIRDLESAPRISEEISLYPHEIAERVASGQFVQFELGEPSQDGDKEGDFAADPMRPHLFIEQHRRIDLDEDGYPEPYIVTVHKDTETVARIVADFDQTDVQMNEAGRVLSIRRSSHYAVYHFLPHPGGGFWGLGLGMLLGDISDTINTIINQLLDSAHMSSLGAGWIGADFRLPGGKTRFKPGEWKMVKATGTDIRQSLVPMQFPEPSPVMFQLLGLLIEAGREIASIKDIMTGEANRQMTATTTLALIEQGQMLFSAAYKRAWRALKAEFRLIAAINARTLSPEEYQAFHDTPEPADPARDYDMSDMDIAPVSDPRSITNPQKLAKAQMLMEMAQAGLVDPAQAALRMLEAGGIEDAESLLPQPDPVAAEAQKISVELEIKKALAEVEKMKTEMIKNIAQAEAAEVGPQMQQYIAQLDFISGMLGNNGGPEQGSTGGMEGAPGNGTPSQADVAAILSGMGGPGGVAPGNGGGQPGGMAPVAGI